jgi:hypothetical protein
MAHSLLEDASKNVSTAVCRSLFKKVGSDADGKDLRVHDCFEIDEKTWIVTKVKKQPLYNQFFGTARCQNAIKELMLDELATWHSVRALAVTKMDDGEVFIGRVVKIQGRRGKACLENGTYTRNTTKSTTQVSRLMAAPLAPSIAPAPLAPVGEQGDPMDLDQGDGALKVLLERVDKQEAELALNGNIVKNLCAQGSRAKEQHAILEAKLAEAAVRERKQHSELELLKAERRADGLRQLREFEKEQLQEQEAKKLREEKAKNGKWPNPYVTPKASVDPYVTPKASVAEDHLPEDEAQVKRDADSAKALLWRPQIEGHFPSELWSGQSGQCARLKLLMRSARRGLLLRKLLCVLLRRLLRVLLRLATALCWRS